MTVSLFFAFCTDSVNTTKIPIHIPDTDTKIEALKERAALEISSPIDEISLVFCGNVLKDNKSFAECGLRPGITINITTKEEKLKPARIGPDISQHVLVMQLRTATKNANFRSTMQRLSISEVMQNMINEVPELADDYIAQAILRDPELVIQITELTALRKALEKHPSLLQGLQHITTMVNEATEAPDSSNASSSRPSHFALENFSDDDEDMESSQSSDSQPQRADSPLNPSFMAAQLTAALDTAQAIGITAQQAPRPISSEMFSQALEQAIATSENPPSNTNRTEREEELANLESTSILLVQQLHQMRELGLRDDTLNLQALQATDWNMLEAVNLVFSGGLADNDQERME